MNLKPRAWLGVIGLAVLVAAAACSSSEEPTPTPQSQTATPAVQPAAPATPETSPSPELSPRPQSVEEAPVSPPEEEQKPPLRLRFGASSWSTDFTKTSITIDEIRGGVAKDGIPAIDNPQFDTPTEASVWLADVEPVLALEINGDARAYPLQILVWNEIANDVVGGVPVAVNY